jgi:hypothetical protein
MDAVFARLYPLLKDMLEAARKEDQTEVFRIHKSFSRVFDPSYARKIFQKEDC